MHTKTIFPRIIHGNISGTADITGDPVIKNEVIGVITERITPQSRPQNTVTIISAALIIGPVINTLVFLKN